MQKGNFLGIVLWVCKRVFCTKEYTLRYYWYKSEKLCFEPWEIATVTHCDNSWILNVAICDLSQFVIKAVTAQTESNNTENVFWVLGVPRFTFDTIMKSCIFTHFGVISRVYLFVCMYISYKAQNHCTQKTFLKGSDFDVNMFSALRSIPSVTMKDSEKLCFEPSQMATVTNCDTTVAICDFSQFVIKAVTAQTESNDTENVFCVLGRLPMFTFDMNMKTYIIAHAGVISLVYLFVCMHISYKANNRCTKETFLIGSDVDVNIFSAFRSILSGTIDIILKRCILNRHKLRQSQIATLLSHFVICHNLWSRPWRHKLSQITLITCSGYLGEYPCSLLTWIWKLTFLPIQVLFHWYICLCVCISVIKPIIDVQRKPSWKGPMLMWTSSLHLGVNLLAQLTSFWNVVFWTVTNCDSHKLRHYRRNLWFVAICDQSRDGAN